MRTNVVVVTAPLLDDDAVLLPAAEPFDAQAFVLELAAIFIEELRNTKAPDGMPWYDKVAQAFAVFLPVRSVGVMGDGRTYDFVVALRAVETTDFMTAHWGTCPTSCLAASPTASSTRCAASTA